ncbi:MAG: hypothetical protein NC191_00010 [Muribaculaceae bacterium]|nr:hypothetical protein [Muribaculaceae bacterium]
MINSISQADAYSRMKGVRNETPILWTDLLKTPGAVAVQITARNNLMLDKIMTNQETILKNQAEILKKLNSGNKLNINA